MSLSQTFWIRPAQACLVRLNSSQTGIGRFQWSMHKWGVALSCNCECGAHEQTADHIILYSYPTHRAPNVRRGMSLLLDDIRC